MRLKDRVALVTGAASGLGEATVRLFAEEGAKIVAVDLQQTLLQEAHGQNPAVHCIAQDITAPDAPARLMAAAMAQFGRLDILVNNAGIEGARVPLADSTDANWARVFDVNVDSVFRLSRAALPLLSTGGGGRIVNVASVIGFFGIPGVPAYAASKQAVAGLTRALAVELAASAITVNCIAPGLVRTGITVGRSEERLQAIANRVPLGRLGQPGDIAKAVLFFVSEDAAYVTGQTMFVDGGWTINLG